MFTDTHCHIHEADYQLAVDDVLDRAKQADVSRLICIGTNLESSHRAVALAQQVTCVWVAVGVHPHDTAQFDEDTVENLTLLINSDRASQNQRIVGVGEIGLDYFYDNAPRMKQIEALESQLQLAVNFQLPISFHVRDAFDDFWPIFDNFKSLTGVLHSFTDTKQNLEKALQRGLFIGVNGISVFTKDKAQQALYASIPLKSLLLETDAPFLTPPPYRGTINESAYVALIGAHHARLRNLEVKTIATQTTANAQALFSI